MEKKSATHTEDPGKHTQRLSMQQDLADSGQKQRSETNGQSSEKKHKNKATDGSGQKASPLHKLYHQYESPDKINANKS